MRRRHLPEAWLFADERLGERLWEVLNRLPRGSGVVITGSRKDGEAIRRIARRRGLMIAEERRGEAVRVHDMRELRRALGRGASILFISSLHPTRSHPGRRPLPLMRAATLARLTRGRAYALGGMDQKRFAAVRPLAFRGWGGIDAWLKT